MEEPWKRILSWLLVLLLGHISKFWVLGFRINHTSIDLDLRRLHPAPVTSSEIKLGPEVYAMLQAAMQRRGETRVLFSSEEPLQPPSLSPDQVLGRQRPSEGFSSLSELKALVAEQEAMVGLPDGLKQLLAQESLVRPQKRTSPPKQSQSTNRLQEVLALFTTLTNLETNSRSDEELQQRTKRFQLDRDDYESLPALPEIFRDMCPSVSKFELVTSAFNEWNHPVEVLPNTWVWTTHCVRPDSPCPATAPDVVAKCKQKQAWVQAFARNQKNDPWRWHWIAISSSCNCGISVAL